ncbi:MAG: diguanylate cyclase [Deltaproteobacteria bacterium]|nr:diguanylate cyclase [Deltaproteobacteria bacterium]TLN02897.1 MAG: diguanylate cyclase [bacterium]
MAEINILVIEDSKTLRKEIIQILQSHAVASHYHEAGDGLEGLKILLAIKIDLVLCDVEMPLLDGFRFLAMVHSREGLRDIPILLLTGKDDISSKVRGLEEGASDYITKPFDASELVARAKLHLKLKRLQDELRRANEILLEISHTDHLTGLYNRRYMMDILEREFLRTARTGSSLSFLIIDLDYFKEINDRYGHQEGDAVLGRAAAVFREQLRSYDIPVRFGGDEFVAVLPEAALSDAQAVAERIRKSLSDIVFSESLEKLKLTASLGFAVYPWKGVETMEDLIREADNALYRGKAKGRNCVNGPLDPA